MRIGFLGFLYLVIGLVVAANEGYLDNLERISPIVRALLAIVLWPLILLGLDVRVER